MGSTFRQLPHHTAIPVFGLVLASGCAVSRGIAPLDRGESAVQVSVGGPFVEYAGAPIPLPISSVGYAYGVDGKTNLHSSLYLTQWVLFGVAGLDLGVARELLGADGARPRIMADATVYMFFGDHAPEGAEGGFRLFPDINITVGWDLGRWDHHVYLGIDSFFQPFPEFRYYPTPFLGGEVKTGKDKAHVGLIVELAYMAFWEDTLPLNPVWHGVNNHGAISVKLGMNVYFGGRR